MALVVTPKKTREYHLDDKRYGSAAEAHASGLQRLSFWKRHPNLNLQLLVKKGRAPALQTRILFFTAVGMRYRGNHTFSETDVVTLRQEPTNPHDRNAVQILVGGQPVAYVLATDCAAVGRGSPKDDGHSFERWRTPTRSILSTSFSIPLSRPNSTVCACIHFTFSNLPASSSISIIPPSLLWF